MVQAPRKQKLRVFAAGAALGLLLGGLVVAAQDLVDGALGANDPRERGRLRQVVASSEPYRDALDLADGERVRELLGGAPAAVLEACGAEDAPDATRLRFRLRLSGPRDAGSLDAAAVHARHEVEPRWRLERVTFTPDATGRAVDLTPGPPAR